MNHWNAAEGDATLKYGSIEVNGKLLPDDRKNLEEGRGY
jgi:hypothetical protein